VGGVVAPAVVVLVAYPHPFPQSPGIFLWSSRVDLVKLSPQGRNIVPDKSLPVFFFTFSLQVDHKIFLKGFQME
jgi:hypothetical protein